MPFISAKVMEKEDRLRELRTTLLKRLAPHFTNPIEWDEPDGLDNSHRLVEVTVRRGFWKIFGKKYIGLLEISGMIAFEDNYTAGVLIRPLDERLALVFSQNEADNLERQIYEIQGVDLYS